MEEQNEILLYSEDEVDSGIVATTETDRKRTNSRRSNGAGSRETTPDLREQINKRDQVDEYRSPPKKNKSSEPQQRPGEKYKNPTWKEKAAKWCSHCGTINAQNQCLFGSEF